MTEPLDPSLLAPGVRSRFVPQGNGLTVHMLEAGWEGPERPMILLLHGFPEIAYSWRRVIGPLAAAGFHVVAPDARGYGRTQGGARGYDIDLAGYGVLNLVRDAVALVHALGRDHVALLAGHDYGAGVAGACALARPDVFRRVALMSAPFRGPPARIPVQRPDDDPDPALARLDPPRKHYQWYFATRAAEADMLGCPQGLHAFLRAYFHQKSADWPGNRPHSLAAWSAAELAKLPAYYVMPYGATMPQAVAPAAPPPGQPCAWLPDAALAVYVQEYLRSGIQGGLNWYRLRTTGLLARELSTFAGRTIDVPAAFLSGRQDWGTYQKAGDFEAMQATTCTDMRMCELIEGAGHWVQQEQPEALVERLLAFVRQPG